jgi:hypothetical protein
MRARYYDSRLGRFVSEDPRVISGNLNRYVYASDDPVNRNDETGTCDVYQVSITFSAAQGGGTSTYSVVVCGGADDGGGTDAGSGTVQDPFAGWTGLITTGDPTLDAVINSGLTHIEIAALIQQMCDKFHFAITIGNVVFIPDNESLGDDPGLLAHEFTHTEQIREMVQEWGVPLGYELFYGAEGILQTIHLAHHALDDPMNPYFTGDIATHPQDWTSYNFEAQAEIVSIAEFPDESTAPLQAAAQRIAPYTVTWVELP